ncbi:MAG: hypothetical protein U0640_13110 [Phycisphaerales bacterium]
MKKFSSLRWTLPVVGLVAAGAGAYVITVPSEPRLHVPISCTNLTAMLLGELSITPTTLAAMGATEQQVSTIVSAARAMCENEGGDFGQAHVACEQASQHLHQLESKAARGGLNSEGLLQLAAARDDVADCGSARAQILSQVASVVGSTLNQEQRAVWANIKAARHVEVPVAHKVVARTDEEWIALRDQLAERRSLATLQDQPHQAAENDAEVQVAQAAIDNNLSSVRQAWMQAIGQE